MRTTNVAIAIAALLLGACGNNEIEVDKSRPISSLPSTPSTVMESMSGKEQGDQATGSAMDAAKNTMDKATDTAKEMTGDSMGKADEMVADADMMDKAKEMAEDSGVTDKAEEMVAGPGGDDLMDKAKEMAEDSGVMDKADEMVADAGAAEVMDKAKEMAGSSEGSDPMKEAMDDAHSMFGAGAAEEAVEEAPVVMAAVSMEDGTALAKKSGCFACHSIDRKILGPGWKDVAAKYAGDKAAGKAHLLNKVAKGGKGVWTEITGGAAMPPYSPRVSDENIEILVDFIIGL